MDTQPPLKRDENLVSLSRDHHDGLLLVWKIKEGLRLNVNSTRIISYLTEVFETELEPHFKVEETLLFTRLASTDPLRSIAEDQHAAIRGMVTQSRMAPNPEGELLL